MTTQTLVKPLTPAAYLEQEVASETRNEYRNGEIIPMAGGTPKHNQISGNSYIAFKLALKKQPYAVFHVDQRLWIPAQQIYTYPDVMVTAKPLTLQEGRKDTVLNPCLIAEVLSKSTKNYDRSEKFIYYRSIASFKEYLLIEQDRVYVEHFYQTDLKKWSLTEYTEIDDVIILESVGIELSLADIYEDTE